MTLKLHHVGAVVSNTIPRVVLVDIFHKASLNLIYTDLFPSHAVNVWEILDEHVCRFVGFVEFPNATCTHPTHASVAQVVYKVTPVDDVFAEPPLIVNDHHAGAVAS